MMERQDINTLKILQELHENSKINQRALSKKLDISLGLTNSFIKRLVNKGYFKITTLPRSRIKYILTPKGIAEMSRLTYEYFIYSMQYYKMMRKKVNEIFSALSEKNVKMIYFFGVSELAEISYVTLYETEFFFAGIFDEKNYELPFMGYRVKKLPLKINIEQNSLIVVTKMDATNIARDNLISRGVPSNQIVILQCL